MHFQYSAVSLYLGLFTLLFSSLNSVANAVASKPNLPINIQSFSSQFSNREQKSSTNTLPSWSRTQPVQIAQQTYRGRASWYGPGFHGRLTANGETFNSNHLTAAHRTLPFGTKLRVTNLNNGRSVIVRINDRGPFIKGRIIDLSAAAARQIRMIDSGIASVKVEVIE